MIYAKAQTSKSLEHLHSIFVSTYGILFLGTPHNGSSKARIAATTRRIIDALVPKKVIGTSPQLLEALHEHSRILQDITNGFTPLMKNFDIYFFWESLPTNIGYTTDFVRQLSLVVYPRLSSDRSFRNHQQRQSSMELGGVLLPPTTAICVDSIVRTLQDIPLWSVSWYDIRKTPLLGLNDAGFNMRSR